jgi:hypothetical protein
MEHWLGPLSNPLLQLCRVTLISKIRLSTNCLFACSGLNRKACSARYVTGLFTPAIIQDSFQLREPHQTCCCSGCGALGATPTGNVLQVEVCYVVNPARWGHSRGRRNIVTPSSLRVINSSIAVVTQGATASDVRFLP